MSIRQDKISSLIKRDISIFFQRNGSVYCPGGMVSVTVVRMTPDLSLAKVYLSVFGTDKKKEVIEAIKKDASRVRKEMGSALGKVLRAIPEFNFYLDDSLDYAEKIDSILNK